MRTMHLMRGLWRSAMVLATAALVSCGGPGGESTTTTKTETLTITIDNATLTASSVAVVTATLKDGAGTPKVGQQITFTTDGNFGILSPASGVWLTDSTGVATIQLSSGPTIGSATVTATSASGTKASLSYSNTAIGNVAASVQLLASSGNLLADGSATVDLIALVKDKNNNTVPNAVVSFSSDAGAITVANNGKSDANGRATAVLSSGGDRSTRTINIKAKTGSLESSTSVSLAGSKITISGIGSVVAGSTTKLTIRAQDGAGKAVADQAITIASSLGNTFTNAGSTVTSVRTDASGQATVTYNATRSGKDTISASALNETGTLQVTVSNVVFTASAPAGQAGLTIPTDGSRPLLNLNTPITIRASYLVSGVPATGKKVTFTTTRGALTNSSAISLDASGNADVQIAADTVGEAVITATTDDGNTSQYVVEFLSVNPNKLILQAERSVVSPRGNTAITATVRDAKNNLVKNQTVNFTVTDATGGTLSVASGLTDSDGRTSTTYTAGNSSGSVTNATIDARLASNPSISGTTQITIAGQSLTVRIGTGNSIETLNSTQYGLPYSALVTDAAGNPVNGASLKLVVEPLRYFKGYHYWSGTLWVPISQISEFTTQSASCGFGAALQGTDSSTTPATLSCALPIAPTVCANEDSLATGGVNNGILEQGEDSNGNGKLEPGFVAATSSPNATTDSTGSAFFRIIYAKDRANWVEVKLTVSASVQGTEGSTSAVFVLPGAGTDYSNLTIAPPGATSPYGRALSCSNPN